MKIPPPVFPREHGAWAVLFVPFAVAMSISGTVSFDLALLALSALAVFLSYVPVHTMLRNVLGQPQKKERMHQSKFWGITYLTTGAVFVLPLVAKGLLLLPVVGAVGAISFFGNFLLTMRHPKTIASDLVAVSGLSLSAPAAYYVATGLFNQTALLLWVLNLLFFGCSVLYVHMKIRAVTLQKSDLRLPEKLSLGRLNVLYHAAVLTVVGFLAVWQYTAQFAFLAFVPMAIHAVYGTLKLSGRVRFKNLGLLLLGQSLLFGFLLGILQ